MSQAITDNGISPDMTNLSQEHEADPACIMGMESINRVAKIPVIESGLSVATSLYSKVKDYNSLTQWTLSTAEGTVHKAAELTSSLATPMVSHLQQPIKKVDGILCTGLDYVEEKLPAIKLPPGEMYTGAKEKMTHAVEEAKHYVEPAVESAKHYVEPAVVTAKHYVEPAIETAKQFVEPAVETAKHLVEPAVEKACAIRDYGVQQVEKMIHKKEAQQGSEGNDKEQKEEMVNGSS
ncbi:lipid storage droplets surface-binding protein 1-like [Onthophagus taurus]|uniref:lipid storage droplets surface-binding protein 1-like n=1 Tax=Onthophagus taurus TaxID=166361 RepID=UPI0039BE6FB6